MWGLEACPPRWSLVHPLMGNGMSQARLLSICGTYSPGGFEPVSAAFRNGGGWGMVMLGVLWGATTRSWSSCGHMCQCC